MGELNFTFYNQDASELAKQLLGKVIRRKVGKHWLSARIIETEAYYLNEKASHSSKGFTEKRKAMFMPAGTIYMYYSRGKDSMNISAKGEGNAVLVKSAYPYFDDLSPEATWEIMQGHHGDGRPLQRLCNGQTLLCTSLNITVKEWDQQQFDASQFFIEDCGLDVKDILVTTRMGIPEDRDAHLPYRFVDREFLKFCTSRSHR